MFTVLTEREKDIAALSERVRNRETLISELTTYVRHLKKHVLDEDQKAQRINLSQLVVKVDEKNVPQDAKKRVA